MINVIINRINIYIHIYHIYPYLILHISETGAFFPLPSITMLPKELTILSPSHRRARVHICVLWHNFCYSFIIPTTFSIQIQEIIIYNI